VDHDPASFANLLGAAVVLTADGAAHPSPNAATAVSAARTAVLSGDRHAVVLEIKPFQYADPARYSEYLGETARAFAETEVTVVFDHRIPAGHRLEAHRLLVVSTSPNEFPTHIRSHEQTRPVGVSVMRRRTPYHRDIDVELAIVAVDPGCARSVHHAAHTLCGPSPFCARVSLRDVALSLGMSPDDSYVRSMWAATLETELPDLDPEELRRRRVAAVLVRGGLRPRSIEQTVLDLTR